MSEITRLKAAVHEIRCGECRVTWSSWLQRLLGMKRGFTPKLSKSRALLVDRARRAEAIVERVHEWVNSDVVTARSSFGDGYREALRDIRDLLRAPQGPAPAPTAVTAATEAHGPTGGSDG